MFRQSEPPSSGIFFLQSASDTIDRWSDKANRILYTHYVLCDSTDPGMRGTGYFLWDFYGHGSGIAWIQSVFIINNSLSMAIFRGSFVSILYPFCLLACNVSYWLDTGNTLRRDK